MFPAWGPILRGVWFLGVTTPCSRVVTLICNPCPLFSPPTLSIFFGKYQCKRLFSVYGYTTYSCFFLCLCKSNNEHIYEPWETWRWCSSGCVWHCAVGGQCWLWWPGNITPQTSTGLTRHSTDGRSTDQGTMCSMTWYRSLLVWDWLTIPHWHRYRWIDWLCKGIS